MELAAQGLSRIVRSGRRVPDRQEAPFVVIAQEAERGDVEVQGRCSLHIQSHPGDGDRTKEVPVRESEHPAACSRGKVDELRCSRVDLRRCLAAGASILIQLPIGPRFANRLGGHTLVFAVIHLAQERRQLRLGESCELGGAPGPLQRAREHGAELELLEAAAQVRRLLFTLRCQRQVRLASVPSVEAPLGLAVAREIELDAQAGLPIISGLPERNERLALSITAPARTRWPGRTQTNPTEACPPCSFSASLTADSTRLAA